MTDLLRIADRASGNVWTLLPRWHLPWRGGRRRRRLDVRDLPQQLRHDIGLEDTRAPRPRGPRD